MVVDAMGGCDVVFFSGDLTYSGSKRQFERVQDTMNQIWTCFGKSKPQLLAIPGNHDVDRTRCRDKARFLTETWATKQDVQEEFWSDPDCLNRRTVRKAFHNYTKCVQSLDSRPPAKDGILPGEFSSSLNIGEFKLGVLGLNTAFKQLTGEDVRKELSMSPRQLDALTEEAGGLETWTTNHDLTILLSHHSSNWLDKPSRKWLRSIKRKYNLFHLCGHTHSRKEYGINQSEKDHLSLQGSSFFGLEFLGDRGKERRHGYVGGEILLVDGRQMLRLWPRTTTFPRDHRIIPDHYCFDLEPSKEHTKLVHLDSRIES